MFIAIFFAPVLVVFGQYLFLSSREPNVCSLCD